MADMRVIRMFVDLRFSLACAFVKRTFWERKRNSR